MSAFQGALIITGPTACGKSALALDVAERVGAEIVAVDSMTVYRGMDIGTAKPTRADRDRVPHHLIDILEPWESMSVAVWLSRAEEACRDIRNRGKKALLVGGTPFYLKALFHGLFPGPPADERLRRELEAEARQEGNESLHRRLAAVDPRTASRLHPNDVRRVVRALEVYSLTGKPISASQSTWDTPAFASDLSAVPTAQRIAAALLVLPRDILYDQISRRVDGMLSHGFLEEVRRLRELPRPLSREASQALGYRELLAYLSSQGPSWEATVELIRIHTRQFAKRQLTWFRHLSGLQPFDARSECLVEGICTFWKECAGNEIDTSA